ncbi:MAG: DUF6517 family protein [Haloarculaceae archaeon]
MDEPDGEGGNQGERSGVSDATAGDDRGERGDAPADGPGAGTTGPTNGGDETSRAGEAESESESESETRGRWTRKRVALAGTVGVAVACLAVVLVLVPTQILGLVVSDSATFAAAPAAPPDETVGDLGYELTNATEVVAERELSVAGQERTIVVRSQQRTYERTLSVGNETYTSGRFVSFASPLVEIAGAPQNPVADMSHRELLERFGSRVAAWSGNPSLDRVGEREATMLGQPTSVSVFEANVTVDGTARTVTAYVATVQDDGDVVVAVGTRSDRFPDQHDAVLRLVETLDHPAR